MATEDGLLREFLNIKRKRPSTLGLGHDHLGPRLTWNRDQETTENRITISSLQHGMAPRALLHLDRSIHMTTSWQWYALVTVAHPCF